MPMDALGVEYGIGFMLATALLHCIGIGVGMATGMSSRTWGDNVYRCAGGLASLRASCCLCDVSEASEKRLPRGPDF